MTSWNPQIVVIEKVVKHTGADNLDIVTVLGDYPIVTKHGDYKVGDIASYIPIDTILPDEEKYYFLTPKKYEQRLIDNEIKNIAIGYKYELGNVPENKRVVKAKKFYGVYSQGLLFKPVEGLLVGDSIVEQLGLKKIEEEEEENARKLKSTRNFGKSPNGWNIPYYDIRNVREYINLLNDENEVILLEKIHGSNFSCCYDDVENKFYVKSRRFYKEKNEDDSWWDIAIRNGLEEKLKKYPMYIFFGELTGGVGGFPYDSKVINGKLETTIHFFDIFDVKANSYLDYDDFVNILKDLNLSQAPLIYRGKWLNKDDMYKMGEIKTLLGQKHIAEGWVLRLPKEKNIEGIGRFQFKYVSEQYNLNKK